MFVGDSFRMKSGESLTIQAYRGSKDIDVVFDEGTVLNVEACQIQRKTVENPNARTCCGVGFRGIGEYSTRHFSAKIWRGVITRCYGSHDKYKHYNDCTVENHWHNMQNFCEWYMSQKGFDKAWAIDKDIIVKDNKVYSPDTCVLLPQELNNFDAKRESLRGDLPIGVVLSNCGTKYIAAGTFGSYHKRYIGRYNSPEAAFYAYKKVKEGHARHIAEKYNGILDDRAIIAFYNYEVDIND